MDYHPLWSMSVCTPKEDLIWHYHFPGIGTEYTFSKPIFQLFHGNRYLTWKVWKILWQIFNYSRAYSWIMLLPQALNILEKYENHPHCLSDERILPVLSNQKTNAYLKEIAAVCGIDRNISFHIARHTFATTVTLSNGVPIESVSKMLGHSNIKTTQLYAKIVDKKIGNDMKTLRQKLMT